MVDGNAKPLLLRSTAELLGVLQINANYVAGKDEFSDRLADKFPKLWDGISCLCGQQLQLHIDPSVPPIATKYNRVPFHRREKVKKKDPEACGCQHHKKGDRLTYRMGVKNPHSTHTEKTRRQ